jgi:peptidoglycan hydrolase-like protein with peptidoglycan-binding domain/DNA invertase Pin-like site-specific DNA recombinase
MSRSIWAAAGASMFAFALTPGVALAAGGGSSAARPASAHAKQDTHPRRRPGAIKRLRHLAARADAPRHVAVLLAPGSGYQQAAGSGRVRVLQRRLAGSGFAPGPIDGRYGPLTTQAVERFQGAHGLTVDGLVGPRTLAALSATASAGLFPGAGYQAAGSGRVRVLQRRLAGLGFVPGPIDGRYGPLTTQAVERFQGAHGLQVDGIAGPQTVTHLRLRTITHLRKQAPSRPRPSVSYRPSGRAQAPRNGGRASHSGGWLLTGWPVLLGAFGLGLLLSIGLYTRERRDARRSDRLIPSADTRSDAQEAGLGQHPNLGVAPEAHSDPAGREGASRRVDQHGEASLPPVSPNGVAASGVPVVGYASVCGWGEAGSRELKQQAEVITRECERRGLVLLEVVGEREPANSKPFGRPGLAYAVERISTREARGLVVSELSRLTHSAADLGRVIDWLVRSDARLVAAAPALDTAEQNGRLAADLLVEISSWERKWLSERTRNGLQAARRNGRRAVTDDPDLSERIAQMRARGMTLHAIADQLNQDGVPTVRGGAKWRHSSVQAATGYQRHQRPTPDPPPNQQQPDHEER